MAKMTATLTYSGILLISDILFTVRFMLKQMSQTDGLAVIVCCFSVILLVLLTLRLLEFSSKLQIWGFFLFGQMFDNVEPKVSPENCEPEQGHTATQSKSQAYAL